MVLLVFHIHQPFNRRRRSLPNHFFRNLILDTSGGGVTPRIGRKYLQVVAIEGFPAESYSGILTELGELPFDYRWNTRYIFLDSWEALSHIERFRRKWKQQVIPFLAQL